MLDFNRPILFSMNNERPEGFLLIDDCVFNLQVDDPIANRYPISRPTIEFMFEHNLWEFIQYMDVPQEQAKDEETDQATDGHSAPTEVGGAIKSDGGSSTYYDIPVPEWLLDRLIDRFADGNAYIKTEELIEIIFQSDFDASNAFKSLVRMWGTFNGAGKAGNSLSYERKKIEYSIDKLQQRFERQEAV